MIALLEAKRAGYRRVEARPAGPAVVLPGRAEQRQVTAQAVVGPTAFLVQQRA